MKKKFFTICLVSVLIFSSFVLGFFVTTSYGEGLGLPFGGHEVFWVPCTCSAALWIYYIPATDAGVPSADFPGGALAYTPYSTLLYSAYNVETPGVWHLGQYLPGVQSCWMAAFFGCFPLPVLGTETQVGTSLSPVAF